MLFASQFKFHVLGTYLYLLTKKNSQVQWDSSVYFSRLAFTSRYALDLISMVWIFASISAYFYLVSKILTCLFEVCGYRNVNFFLLRTRRSLSLCWSRCLIYQFSNRFILINYLSSFYFINLFTHSRLCDLHTLEIHTCINF